ncbi:DUF1178 family protein [Mameliella sediminis]|uniref:DUF1178 family protein n=1 Tax=Mameliella sediminis TaxID=2836866 RepID=UPI001C45C9E3|nr:DUF1178 family protein [Mameliella sediminis]MBV7396640.1 DUF1178 family protein [Mameliella sediminis]MBY6116547.1 DUF1178 family protein [Antarctobacter heliothermus]MBY6146300.1 DUF1178 family protein [Mameliella alba]MCA0955698.1 DUF1178 family protein [Mameliella alba]
MIQYSLKCTEGHQFDSWFQSASAFDKLQAAGHVACAICGSAKVEKALMAPRVGHGETEKPAKPLTREKNAAEQALAALKAHVEANSDYVGNRFAQEARAMHAGEAPERPIWGEAKGHEAKALIEEGIKVAPLPFTPTRKSN